MNHSRPGHDRLARVSLGGRLCILLEACRNRLALTSPRELCRSATLVRSGCSPPDSGVTGITM